MTTENNKIIAEFMGYIDNGCSEEGFLINPITNFDEEINDLKYHNDWNWLMEVVEKIESLGYWTEICYSNLGTKTREGKITWCEITKENHLDLFKDDCFTKIVRTEGSKKEAVYNACIEFIKWYNEQNKV